MDHPGQDETILMTNPIKRTYDTLNNINRMVTYRKLRQHRVMCGRKRSADVLIEAVLAISNKVPQSCARAAPRMPAHPRAATPLFIIATFNHREEMQSVAINILCIGL